MLEIIKQGHAVPPRGRHARRGASASFAKMGETFKVEIIDAIPQDEEVSLYKHGAPANEWVDVCEGPHVPVDRASSRR